MKHTDVDPKKNPAYSQNLFRFLKRHKGDNNIFCRNKNGRLFIGRYFDGDLIGVSVNGILSNPKAHYWCYSGYELETEVDNKFEAEYVRIGVCAIDTLHDWHYEGRFEEICATHRRCKWCGQVQHREIKRRVVKTTTWVSEPSSSLQE